MRTTITKSKPHSQKLGALEPIAALNRIRILEDGDPLVDIRERCPAVLTADTICPYLRANVAEMLNRAQAALPAGHRFQVGTALRTLSMQKSGYDRFFRKMQAEHPQWPFSALRRATNQYFAPYDQPAPPGHCTGGAVDVTLLGPGGAPADVTSPCEHWEAAYTWSDKIGPQAKRNRMLMVNAMLGAGFSNCREEFWHYSWGDSAWAVRTGETTCPYGWIAPPAAVEARFAGGLAGGIRQEAETEWLCRAGVHSDGQPGIRLGLFWAEERETLIRIEWPGAPPEQLWSRAGAKGAWRPITVEHGGNSLLIRLAPNAARVYISDRTD